MLDEAGAFRRLPPVTAGLTAAPGALRPEGLRTPCGLRRETCDRTIYQTSVTCIHKYTEYIYIYIFLFIHLFIYSLIDLFTYLLIYLFIYLFFIYLFIYSYSFTYIHVSV